VGGGLGAILPRWRLTYGQREMAAAAMMEAGIDISWRWATEQYLLERRITAFGGRGVASRAGVKAKIGWRILGENCIRWRIVAETVK